MPLSKTQCPQDFGPRQGWNRASAGIVPARHVRSESLYVGCSWSRLDTGRRSEMSMVVFTIAPRLHAEHGETFEAERIGDRCDVVSDGRYQPTGPTGRATIAGSVVDHGSNADAVVHICGVADVAAAG